MRICDNLKNYYSLNMLLLFDRNKWLLFILLWRRFMQCITCQTERLSLFSEVIKLNLTEFVYSSVNKMPLTAVTVPILPVGRFPWLHLWICFWQVAFSFYGEAWTLKSFLQAQMWDHSSVFLSGTKGFKVTLRSIVGVF